MLRFFQQFSYLYNFHFNETTEDYQKRLDRESREYYQNREKEIDKFRTFARLLPVNNISWLGCLSFIEKLNKLTGENFALPSFEQWYFAAIGGLNSLGYKYSGSSNALEVGHLRIGHGLSQNNVISVKPINIPAIVKRSKDPEPQYCQVKKHKANELGIYDMTGGVNEWLDSAGKLIGGSYYSPITDITKERLFGYKTYSSSRFMNYSIDPQRDLYGFRLVLQKKKKYYAIPQPIDWTVKNSEFEKEFFNYIVSNGSLGVIRDYKATMYACHPRSLTYNHKSFAYFNMRSPTYKVFLCPQNISDFAGHCFEQFTSRRRFVEFCKSQFIKLLNILTKEHKVLVIDNLGINLDEVLGYKKLQFTCDSSMYKRPQDKIFVDVLASNQIWTNSDDVITNYNIISRSSNEVRGRLRFAEDVVLIKIEDTITADKQREITTDAFDILSYTTDIFKLNIILGCMCDFMNSINDFKEYSSEDNRCRFNGLIFNMRENVLKHERFNLSEYNNSDIINNWLTYQNKGGEYKIDTSLGDENGDVIIIDPIFHVLPCDVLAEWSNSARNLHKPKFRSILV